MTNQNKIYLELFFISFLSLFIELFVIRFLSCDIRLFSIFKTLPLITCFLGLGLGFAYQKHDMFKFSVLALFIFIVSVVLLDSIGVGLCGFPSSVNCQWQNLSISFQSFYYYLFIMPILLTGPLLLCFCLGTRLGYLFNQLPSLQAYSVDLIGAIVGSVIFSILSYSKIPMPGLLLIPVIILLKYSTLNNIKSKLSFLNLILMLATFACLYIPIKPTFVLLDLIEEKCDFKTYWSPLQRVDIAILKDKNNNCQAIELGVNRGFYQLYSNDSNLIPNGLSTIPKSKFEQKLLDRFVQYRLAYKLIPHQKLDNVLIVGAGLGQNVLTALECGAKHIDAVEIDPVILDLGKKYNPWYKNKNVNLINDDARHFINTTKQKYDLILYGFLDSQAVAGQGSSVRLDCYVYTKESIEAAKNLLRKDGFMFLDFVNIKPWIQERLISTMYQALKNNFLILIADPKHSKMQDICFIYNSDINVNKVNLPDCYKLIQPKMANFSNSVLTDDYPFLYVQPGVIDWYYLIILGEVLLFSFIATFNVIKDRPKSIYMQLFFLGAGFLLLELTTIARLTLVFGTTWLTSSMVINGILVMVYLANILVIRFKDFVEKNQNLIYLLLGFSLFATKFIDIEPFLKLFDNYYVSSFLLLVILIAPVLFAGLIFPIALTKCDSNAKAFTYNLLGAMLGGILEYLSYFWGNNGLVTISLILYLISFLFYYQYARPKK